MNNVSIDIDKITVDDVRTIEQDIAYGINVVRSNYSDYPNFKENHFSLNSVKMFTIRTQYLYLP